MQQPRGIAVILGVVISLGIIAVVVTGVVLIQRKPAVPAATNTNTALNLACTIDADCSSYCGADACYQPICGTTTIGGTGSCTCRSLCGPIVPAANTNASANVNASTNANINSSVSTAGWKTYTNSDTGYSFMYPPSFSVQAEVSGDVVINGTNSAALKPFVRVSTDSVAGALDDYNPSTAKSVEVTINGATATKMTGTMDVGGDVLTYVFVKNGRTYMARGPNISENQNIFQTFTFLDETAGWKTYTNEVLDFSIQYPPTWKIKEENRNNEKWVTIYDDITKTGNFGSPQIIVQEKADLYPKDNCLLGTKQLTVAGITRTQQTEGCGYAGSGITTFFSKSTGYLTVTWTTDWENYSAEYNQILSTFTFTK